MNQMRLLGFLVIAIFTVLVYYPSLWHVPRSDQIVYFYVTANKHDWVSLAISCFDLNRWGTFAPGDERLFRPLLYFILGTEKFLFNYNFWIWQAMGVLLHLMVVWLILRLLWRMVGPQVALACALFFAMLLMNMEMVIWTHVHSYLIFVILTLIVLDQVYLCIASEAQDQRKNIMIIALCFFIAGFIYETANIFAIIVAIFLIRKKNAWMIFIPPLIYVIFDVMNLNSHHIAALKGTVPFLGGAFPSMLKGLASVMVAWGFWIYGALWPGLVQMYFDARNMIQESSFNPGMVFLGIACAIGLLVITFRKLKDPQRNFVLLMMTMMFFYALVIVIGRTQEHGIRVVLSRNVHYFYPFWAMLIIIVGGLIGSIKNHSLQLILAGILVVLSVVNGIKLYQINDIQARGSRPTILLVRSVEQLIKEKKNEKDFSFYISPYFPGNYGYTDGHGLKSSFIEMLFPQYFKEKMAKYSFNQR